MKYLSAISTKCKVGSRVTLGCAIFLIANLAIAESMLEEVVVTARKKGAGEAVQDVPLSITAVSGDMIENRFMTDLTDLGNIAPNVQLSAVGSLPGTANFFIRGMGVFGSIPSDETTVGIILDGVYLGVNSGALNNLFDIETVEVLRGPQGTLFGRNVTGGAVIVNSRRPTEEFGGRVLARVGSDGQFKLDGSIGGALSDKTLGRVALGYETNDDYFDNIAGPDRGEATHKYIRPSVTFRPNDNLDITLIGEYRDFEGDGVIAKNLFDTFLDDHQLSTDLDGKAEYETKQLTADMDWSLGESSNLRIIAAWRDTHTAGELDGDGRNLVGVHSNEPWTTNQDQVSLEVRYFTQLTDRADLTAGIYYFDQSIEYIESRAVNGGQLVTGMNIPGSTTVLVGAGGLLEHDSLGIFAQSDIDLNDAFTLTLGTRYTTEEKEAQVANFGLCAADGTNCNYAFNDKDDWNFLSGYAGIDWVLSDDAHVYASWTRSFRSGGYNLRVSGSASPGPYDEEQVDGLELGFKADWLDGKVRTNVAIFSNDYKDLQRTVLTGGGASGTVQTKINAAEATVKGLELELTAFVTDQFRLNASLGYVDAGYDSIRGEGLSVDNDFSNVPEVSANLSLAYNVPLNSGAAIDVRGSYTYTDEQFADDANAILLDSYSVADASIAYTSPDSNMKISLYVKNLTDEEYTNFALPAPLNALWGIAPPRRYGIELSYDY